MCLAVRGVVSHGLVLAGGAGSSADGLGADRQAGSGGLAVEQDERHRAICGLAHASAGILGRELGDGATASATGAPETSLVGRQIQGRVGRTLGGGTIKFYFEPLCHRGK